MDVLGFSSNGIKLMQSAIRERLQEEGAMPSTQQKTYGVRKHPDINEMGDELETRREPAARSTQRYPGDWRERLVPGGRRG